MSLQELAYVATIIMGLAAALTIFGFFNSWIDKNREPSERGQPNKEPGDKEKNFKGDDVEAQK